MFWLVSQILGWVLLGALAGGLIGWALQCRKCAHETEGLRKSLAKAYNDKQVVEPDEYRVSGGINNIGSSSLINAEKYSILVNQLEAEKEEVAGLKAKLALAGATGQAEPKQVLAGLSSDAGKSDLPARDGQLTWRNRYLESRVRFLENKVTDLESVPIDHNQSVEIDSSYVQNTISASDAVENSDTQQVLNDFDSIDLELPQDAFLEDLSAATLSGVDDPKISMDVNFIEQPSTNRKSHETSEESNLSPKESDDELVDVQSLIWRNRYLEGRVRYLEEDFPDEEPANTSTMVDVSDIRETAGTDLDTIADSQRIRSASVQSSEVDAEVERLRWRARYLEGRVRFLEENLAESELRLQKNSISPVLESIETSSSKLERSNKDRSQWRNDYLAEKLRYVQETESPENSTLQNVTNTERQGIEVAPNNDRPKWREAYLKERIRYGEEVLGTANLQSSPVREYVTDIEMDRLRWRSRYLEERLKFVQNELEEMKATKIRVRSSFVGNAAKQSNSDDSKLRTALARLKWREQYNQALNERLVSRLETQITERTVQAETSSTDELEVNRLAWKNRYLRSRIKFLEENLESSDRNALQLNEELKHLKSSLLQIESSDTGYGDESETTRLKWRNSYLMGRIGYLEEGKTDQSFVQPAPNEKPGDALDNIEALSEFRASRSFVGREIIEGEDTEISLNLTSELNSKREEKPKRKRSSRKRTERKARKTTKKTTVVETTSNADAFQESFQTSEYFVEGDSATGRPAYLSQPILGTQDDLREIAGVGPKIETILHDLGIFHFYQIAAWTRKEVEWVDNYLTFKGRIDRENWIDQSKKLARGEETDGQRKYRSGKHV